MKRYNELYDFDTTCSWLALLFTLIFLAVAIAFFLYDHNEIDNPEPVINHLPRTR